MSQVTYGILGLGQLGVRIAQRMIDSGIDPANMYVVDRPSSRKHARQMGLRLVTLEEMGRVDVLLVVVKPFQAESVLASIGSARNKVVVSFMAGVSLSQMSGWLPGVPLVRAMTTTACQVGCGVGLYATSEEGESESLKLVEDLLVRLGRHDRVVLESHVQVYATVLSSLTGMVYQLLGDFERGMNHIGAPRQYRELMLEAVAASVAYAQKREGTHLLALAQEVTSPAGTTDAARLVLEEHRVTYAIIQAISAAARKAGG